MKTTAVILTLALALVASTGCATKKFVRGETQAVHTRVDEVEGQVEEAQTRIGRNEQQIGEASRTAQEALQRAQEAGKLAEGKLLYETVLTDDKVKFGFDVAKLSPEAQSALDTFANQLVQEGRGVYIEIQGHTDATGSEDYNEQLGLERAETVRRYLSQQHKFPLHRINVISYGETAAVADNKSREGRAQNRRVALVVLR
jgi:outer membrane protein OmpA-like peptidoglycan-associated protein